MSCNSYNFMTGEDTPTNHHLVNVAGITIRKLTVALNIFRITLALIFGTPVPKVSKPHLGSISSSN